MKKLITICLLVAATFVVNAQTKPTKEETINFLKSSYNSFVGQEIMGGALVTKAEFNYDAINITTSFLDKPFYNETYSLLKWQDLDTTTKQVVSVRGDVRSINIFFTSKIKHVQTYRLANSGDKDEYSYKVEILVPKDKMVSIWKSCLRLSEIAKEENKDPFQD